MRAEKSTIIETAEPERELDFAISLLGPVLEKFVWITEQTEPIGDGKADRLFIARSYDSTSHFETDSDDIMDIYQRFAGKPLVVSKREPME